MWDSSNIIQKSIMKLNRRNNCILGMVFIILGLFSSCVIDYGCSASFKNCTSDTLFIGSSLYNNMDSVKCVVWGESPSSDSKPDTLLKNGDFYFESRDVVYPDSTCFINCCNLSYNSDTCYFFLIKWSDAKRYSWDVIRDKKMYRTWIVVMDKNGNYDKNIRYSDDCLEETR